jgi:hypothetical protein
MRTIMALKREEVEERSKMSSTMLWLMIKYRSGSISCKTLRIYQRKIRRYWEIESLPKNQEIRRRKNSETLTLKLMYSEQDIANSSTSSRIILVILVKRTLLTVYSRVRQKDKKLIMFMGTALSKMVAVKTLWRWCLDLLPW